MGARGRCVAGACGGCVVGARGRVCGGCAWWVCVTGVCGRVCGGCAWQGGEERRKGDGLVHYPRVRGPSARMGQVESGWLFGTLMLVSGDEEGRNVYGLW